MKLNLLKPALEVIDKAVVDKDEAAKLKSELIKLDLQGNTMQRIWRPVGALIFIVIIAALIVDNYLIRPYLGLEIIDIPNMVWAGLFGFISSYGVVRSALDKRGGK